MKFDIGHRVRTKKGGEVGIITSIDSDSTGVYLYLSMYNHDMGYKFNVSAVEHDKEWLREKKLVTILDV